MRPPRPFGLALALALFVLAGCPAARSPGPAPGGTTAARSAPDASAPSPSAAEVAASPAAPVLVARPPLARRYDGRSPAMLSLAQRRILDTLRRAVSAKRGIKLHNDRQANAAATEVCRGMLKNRAPGRLLAFALAVHGVSEANPALIYLVVPPGADPLLLPGFTRGFERYMAEMTAYRRVGIGECRSPDVEGQRVVVLLLTGALRLAPWPRQAAVGEQIQLGGLLLGELRDLALWVTRPDGTVRRRELPLDALTGGRFGVPLRCAEKGVYQVEITGVGRFGTKVLHNAPLYCGLTPPKRTTISPPGPAARDAAAVEARLLRETNAFRRQRGLPTLTPDPALARVARAHNADMLAEGFVGHVSPKTGAPADRVKAAGITALAVRENVARTYSPADVIPGLARSPGHRANLQAIDVDRVGIGVSLDASSDPPTLYVTQLMARRATPLAPGTAADAVAEVIARRRLQWQLAPLSRDAALDQTAAAYLQQRALRGAAAAERYLQRRTRRRSRRFPSLRSARVVARHAELIPQLPLAANPRATHFGLAAAPHAEGVEVVLLVAVPSR